MNRKNLLLFLLFIISVWGCQYKTHTDKSNDIILNENFDSNTRGWTEEFTKAHKTEIENGHLYIHSIDTASVQTSNGPQDFSFLLNLPESYEITSSISLAKPTGYAHFGIMLISSSLEYKFSVSDSGTVSLIEWDYNRRSENRLFTQSLNSGMDTSMKALIFKIDVHFRNFEFFINDKLMGEGIFNTKNWRDIRLFASTGTTISVDYVRIKKSTSGQN